MGVGLDSMEHFLDRTSASVCRQEKRAGATYSCERGACAMWGANAQTRYAKVTKAARGAPGAVILHRNILTGLAAN
jgi:hypothetical protein